MQHPSRLNSICLEDPESKCEFTTVALDNGIHVLRTQGSKNVVREGWVAISPPTPTPLSTSLSSKVLYNRDSSRASLQK